MLEQVRARFRTKHQQSARRFDGLGDDQARLLLMIEGLAEAQSLSEAYASRKVHLNVKGALSTKFAKCMPADSEVLRFWLCLLGVLGMFVFCFLQCTVCCYLAHLYRFCLCERFLIGLVAVHCSC